VLCAAGLAITEVPEPAADAARGDIRKRHYKGRSAGREAGIETGDRRWLVFCLGKLFR
jgi:hypothetical protein